MLPGARVQMEEALFGFHRNREGHHMKRNIRKAGSITVEASFVVPIFFLAVFAFLYLFECLIEQNDLQDQMIQSAKNYLFYEIQDPCIRMEDGIVQMVNWHVKDGNGYCETEVKKSIPGMPAWILQVHLYQRIQVSLYTGRSMTPEATDAEEIYVYVAENGTVYHRDIGCTYLRLGIQEVSGEAVAGLRNQSGGKYKACEICTAGNEAIEYSIVYITPYGGRYHRNKDCSGLRRTIRKVSLSSIGAFPPCSKCGK